MNDELEEVKRKIDIVELVSSYVTLKKAGANYKGLCPFHNEKTPSLMVSPEKQIFKCFGCSEGGDVFSFLMKIEGLGFGDALKTLAERAGVKLKPRHFEVLKPGEQPGQKSRLLDLNELAARLYHKILTDHPAAQKARDYLDKRGLSHETIREFNLGYAPATWDLLIRFVENRGYSEKDLLTAGLAVRKNQTSGGSARSATPGGASDQRLSYDRFRERIVFPINNVLGNTVAFTGRLLADKADSPKYLNSSESAVYHKSSIIYGLDKARLAIRQADLAVIVEGNMDVITCYQAGFKNVVAVSGTALTGEMLLILSRYTSNLAFSFDQDSAGQLAMKRAIGLAGELDLNSKIVVLPPGFKDPDEAIKADPKNWEEAVAKSKPALEYLINILTVKLSDINAKKSVMKEILPVIKILKNQTEQEHYLKMLATRLLVTEQSLKEELKRAKTNEPKLDKSISTSEQSPEISDPARLLAILAAHPEVASANILKAIKTIPAAGKSAELISDIQKLKDADGEELAKIFADHPSDRLKEIWLLTQNDLDDEEAATISSYAEDLARKIQKTAYEEKKSALVAAIATADQQTDKKRRLELLKELNSVIIQGE